uniref:Essential protein Yae1 N-terminal domain-containing protein n=1 Tax=Tetraselmis sp. GSL018 TaxID=582737 RepID=A0A061RQR4_9CHLO|eukprot:CAMPEP_0177583550 /NCGR_PEP_ID=MMETSP0419_2-20121207/3384_1 /TAXON_ID=582737 /ORGANISM="Tetraselmis sp., Strain GSL018" /LENGTH=138 /DNA_ID=CAMNT_0019072953 /DNA_START=179 /DNA_END=595 /DNA_ORIENTATION=-
MQSTDIFDSAVDFELESYNAGKIAGYRDSQFAGFSEGRRIGSTKGFQIGNEIGYVTGCCKLWRQQAEKQPDLVPDRARRAVNKLLSQLLDFPLGDPEDEALQDKLNDVRGKFKAVLAMLGQTQHFYPQDDSKKSKNEF